MKDPQARLALLGTAFAVVLSAFPSTAATAGEPPPPPPVSCEDRPLERPHLVSQQSKEAEYLHAVWSYGALFLRFQPGAPQVAANFGACLEKARAQGDAWSAVAALSVHVERLSTDRWDVDVQTGDAETRIAVDLYENPPWEVASRLVDWVLAQDPAAGEESKAALRNALWTLWIEGYLASLPDTFIGVDLRPYYKYGYTDEILDTWENLKGFHYQPPFSLVLQEDGRFLLTATDPELATDGVVDGMELTDWNGRPVSAIDHGELFDDWIRDEPFDVTFRLAGVPKPISAHARAYIAWDLVFGAFGDILYARVAEFMEGTTERFQALVDAELARSEYRGMVLDLRANGGGVSQPEFIDLFFPPGTPTMTWTKVSDHFSLQVRHRPEGLPYYDLPLIVLIDGGTASMAESFVAAVRQNGRGLLLGEKTYGKGVSQNVYPIRAVGAEGDEGVLTLVNDVLYLPLTRETWHGKGIEPHLEIDPRDKRDIVAAILKRPLLDLDDQSRRDPAFWRAIQILRRPGAWEKMMNYYVPERPGVPVPKPGGTQPQPQDPAQ